MTCSFFTNEKVTETDFVWRYRFFYTTKDTKEFLCVLRENLQISPLSTYFLTDSILNLDIELENSVFRLLAKRYNTEDDVSGVRV